MPASVSPSPLEMALLAEVLGDQGVPMLVLRGGSMAADAAFANQGKSAQILIPKVQVDAAMRALEPLSWRYSWVRTGPLRLLPMRSFWWDGGVALEVYWGCPAAPFPSASLNALTTSLWDSATTAIDGLMRPDPSTLLVFFAVQACRPGRHGTDWESFVRLWSSIDDLAPALAMARRVAVSPALARAIAAAEAQSGPPGPGPVYNGALDFGWRLATAIQARARPRRLSRLLAGQPSLGDSTIRCRVAGVEVLAGPGVFVPTPDADIFVEMASERLDPMGKPTIVEIGTGCGAIALALAHRLMNADVHATDLSRTAVWWARKSAHRLGLARVHFHSGPLLEPLPVALQGRVDLIVANLPFYPPAGYAAIGSVPRATIQGEAEDGLGLVRRLAREAPTLLRPGGTLLLQMFSWQWDKLAAELMELGYKPGSPRFSGPFAICPAVAPQPTPPR